MAKERKFPELSAVAKKVLAFMKENKEALFSDVKNAIPEANPSHMTALVKRNLLTAEKVEVKAVKVVKSKVNRYTANE